MPDCKELQHPFQNDPGVSQKQRIMDDLLSAPEKIDGRTFADLLDYFRQLSRHINYYDTDLTISDWKPFFDKSIPFLLSGIIKYQPEDIIEKVNLYNRLLEKNTSGSGLLLLIYYIYYSIVRPVDTWHVKLKGSGLPVEFVLQKLIKDKLREPVVKFLQYSNTAVSLYQMKPLYFQFLLDNEVWNLNPAQLYKTYDNSADGYTVREKMLALSKHITALIPAFTDSTKLIIGSAEASIEQSLFPLREELQKNHSPHLALVFAFLKLFRYLQDDLNTFTRKHLDFFYKEVLLLKPREAVPDKAHIVFEIQNHLNSYLLEKGLLLKDGKDNNKEEILFSLTEDLVVNKVQVADKKTLFINNLYFKDSEYIEGVYIAPAADKSDGIDKDFKEGDPRSFSTLGSKFSKYVEPENKILKPYPDARLGFILASPVLFLNEGERIVNIQLACRFDELVCEKNKSANNELTDLCVKPLKRPFDNLRVSLSAAAIQQELYKFKLNLVNKVLRTTYTLINLDLIDEAQKKGIEEKTLLKIKTRFLTDNCFKPVCNEKERKYLSKNYVSEKHWKRFLYLSVKNNADKDVLNEIFKPQRAFKIKFSGENEWIEPSQIFHFEIKKTKVDYEFVFKISLSINGSKPAITFYNKKNLKEDFNTTSPLVKIELNNDLGIFFNKKFRKLFVKKSTEKQEDSCCRKVITNCADKISLYDFFRQVRVIEIVEDFPTKINVEVCGLKNFIVQNDESVQDVNSPFYPFGVRPRINSNFYIGSEETFLKKWNTIKLKINWKGFSPVPPFPDIDGFFETYYNGYQDFDVKKGLSTTNQVKGNQFRIQIALLQDGIWNPWIHKVNCNSFPSFSFSPLFLFQQPGGDQFQIVLDRKTEFPLLNFPVEKNIYSGVKRLDVNSRFGFVRLVLKCQDFQHDRYSYILKRQMMAVAKYAGHPGDKTDDKVADAVYYCDTSKSPPAVTGVVIPNEPWTPVISNMAIDYTATALIGDIDLIHLYPFSGTYKHEEIKLQPTLFPAFCDEGTLFIGLKNLLPGSNVNILYQLAEATADAESEKEDVTWYYLDTNQWKPLRTGFEVLDDATNNLTTSGIIKFAFPENMTNDNTILPGGLHWIRASVGKNSRAVSETIGIHTQAIKVEFTNDELNDKLRLELPLPPGSVSKLKDADASVKKIDQPYETFGGRVPEEGGHFYVRASELLRHKGRAIQKFDYERLALEAFPQLFKVKCINHSFALDAHKYSHDYPIAPGYVLLAVIPDLNKLTAVKSFEPRVPVSLLEEITKYLSGRTSPFLRLRVMNPRYEKVHFCLTVKLYKGKDENYYKEKLRQELREFLAPWAVGGYDKLTFGQCIYRSDIVRFLESRDYLDYVTGLEMKHEQNDSVTPDLFKICPDTPRSILIAGEIVVGIEQDDCKRQDNFDRICRINNVFSARN